MVYIGHITYQVVLISTGGYSEAGKTDLCSDRERLLSLLGLYRLVGLTVMDAILLFGIDFLIFLVAAVTLFCSTRMSDSRAESVRLVPPPTRCRRRALLLLSGDLLVLALMATSGILNASLLTLVYFLAFLCICSWMATHHRLDRRYHEARFLLLIYSALHTLAAYAYQCDYAQELILPTTLQARLIGLPALRKSICQGEPAGVATTPDVYRLQLFDQHWTIYVGPLCVLAFYYAAAVMTRYQLLQPCYVRHVRLSLASLMGSGQGSEEQMRDSGKRLMFFALPSGRLQRRSSVVSFAQRPTDMDEETEDFQSCTRSTVENVSLATDGDAGPSIRCRSPPPTSRGRINKNLRHALGLLLQWFSLLSGASHVMTLVAMMAWSITYHSWLTFVLLLWSCVLWMIPNTRRACLRSSPALVAYAELLLILQYVCSLDLTDDELPTKVDGVNMAQIGLEKYYHNSYQPLFIKILYTVVFWITLHQYEELKHAAAVVDVGESIPSEPLPVTALGASPERSMRRPSLMTITSAQVQLRRLLHPLRRLFTRYWVWVVASSLGLIALGSARVVVYRVVYLFFFLAFLLLFQLSYKLWVNLMYTFWLIVVIYSMVVLILIYTYQFENFPTYWKTALHVPIGIQHSLGLQSYSTYDTFVALLVPTLVLILTIWQLNSFHQGFLKVNQDCYGETVISTPRNARDMNGTVLGMQAPTSTEVHPDPLVEATVEYPDFEFPWLSKSRVGRFLTQVNELMWRMLEIHIAKVVFFVVTYVSVTEVCALHFVFVVLVVLALPFRSLQTLFSHCCSLWASGLFVVKMIYQLDFIADGSRSPNCSVRLGISNVSASEFRFDDTVSNMMWIGFKKSPEDLSFCKPYISLVLLFTVQAIVRYRQKYNRLRHKIPEPKQGVVFTSATRCSADDGIKECLMYLVNYFFYKFGVEVCFVAMVACMGHYMDVYALLSSMWLCAVFLLRRRHLSRVWPYYVAYLCMVLPVQYLMAVGLPPEVCAEYLWQDPSRREVREIALWLYLPDLKEPPDARNILVGFVQLMLACCQLFVFSVEGSHISNVAYQGGSNKEIYDRHGTFIGRSPNPVPDFVTDAKSCLSTIQSYVFFSFYWITLAVMFLAGTSHVSIFAMGYVLGCFIFLWNGNDFYTRPMNVLLKKWNTLLAYNVVVIFIKNVLQLIGCVFMEHLLKYSCWMVQLFGIVCFKNGQPRLPIEALGTSSDRQSCLLPSLSEAGLLWDGICLAFLLAQKRLFTSYYFHHVVIEVQVQQRLASRGADMINEIQLEDAQEQRTLERHIMEKIKWKTEKLRANQQKIRMVDDAAPETHYEAIRSGDYYLFDDLPTVDLESDADVRGNRLSVEDEDVKVRGLNALLSTAIKTGSLRRPAEETSWRDGGSSPHPSDGETAVPTEVTAFQLAPLEIHGAAMKSPVQKPIVSSGTSSFCDAPIDPMVADERFSDQLLGYLTFVLALVDSMLISATAKLNTVSRDYRYVVKHLAEEKRQDKKQHYAKGIATRPENITIPRCREQPCVVHRESFLRLESPDVHDKQGYYDQLHRRRPSVVRFLIACYYAMVSRSEVACYMSIVLNQIMSASLLSLPLPLMAFLWGSLSVPRPSKTFWITIITYTEAIVVVKYLFQFDFIDWNEPSPLARSFDAARIIGVEKRSSSSLYALYDLVLLLLLFFHRFMLKSLGLWRDAEYSSASDEESQSDEMYITANAPPASNAVATPNSLKKPPAGPTHNHSPRNTDSCEGHRTESYDTVLHLSNIFDGIVPYTEQFKTFFVDLLHPVYRVTTDVYAYMFLCDFVNFFIMVFGYWAFATGSSEGGVATYVKRNEVPLPFMIMVLAQFALIVVDRALYLRKYILGRLVFQILTVLIIHIWMFFVLPVISQRPFVDINLPPKLWYFIKCIYLMLSAYQIRSGYPSRILGNFFCKKYNYINYVLFKGYMLVPFLYELRSLMDWIWTDTSMSLGYWLKMEDIFSNIFLLKCMRRAEADYPTPRGEKRDSLTKYGLGGLLLVVLILVIWFPLLLFSLGNTVGESLLPSHCSLELSIGGFQPLFKISYQGNAMRPMPPTSWLRLQAEHRAKSNAQAFLANYDAHDVAVVSINGNSTGLWAISPPGRQELVQELNYSGHALQLSLKWELTREKSGTDEYDQTRSTVQVVPLSDPTLRRDLANMISGHTTGEVTVPNILPKYISSSRSGRLEVVKVLDPPGHEYRNLTLRLRSAAALKVGEGAEWWEIREECSNGPPYPFLYNGQSPCSYLDMIVFCDKVFPTALSVFSKYGIIGLYTTFVLVVSRLMRSLRAGSSYVIMFDDLPDVDRVLQLCLDIYLVRESRELLLEEDLFAKLLFLYRSPETLIRWTRPGPLPPSQESV